jgi:hypothetical protein
MSVSFLSPEGILVALVVVVPLGCGVLVARRAERVRRVLGLAEAPRRGNVALVGSALALATALGLACAQPVVAREDTRHVRADAEAFVVVDVSRSMLAAAGPGAPTRLERARLAATRLRADLADVPVGLASLTDRVLPHVFPTADPEPFARALERSIGIGRPAPQRVGIRATAFAVLGGLATQNFFREEIGRRLAIVLTDGETLPVDDDALQGVLAGASPLEFVFVRVWDGDERIYDSDGSIEQAYEPDPASSESLDRFADALGADVFAVGEVGAAARRAREVVGEGPTRQEERVVQDVPLAPYTALAGLVPLLFVLAKRNRA